MFAVGNCNIFELEDKILNDIKELEKKIYLSIIMTEQKNNQDCFIEGKKYPIKYIKEKYKKVNKIMEHIEEIKKKKGII